MRENQQSNHRDIENQRISPTMSLPPIAPPFTRWWAQVEVDDTNQSSINTNEWFYFSFLLRTFFKSKLYINELVRRKYTLPTFSILILLRSLSLFRGVLVLKPQRTHSFVLPPANALPILLRTKIISLFLSTKPRHITLSPTPPPTSSAIIHLLTLSFFTPYCPT